MRLGQGASTSPCAAGGVSSSPKPSTTSRPPARRRRRVAPSSLTASTGEWRVVTAPTVADPPRRRPPGCAGRLAVPVAVAEVVGDLVQPLHHGVVELHLRRAQ